MSVVYCKKTRRQFLVGSGQTLLALPFLPSLFSSQALAQAAAPTDRKLMTFLVDHNMMVDYWIPKATAVTSVGSAGVKEIMLKTLSTMSEVSPMLTAPIFNSLRLADKMTLIRNLELQAGTGHENYAGMGGVRDACPTFDTIIEDSNSVYGATTPPSITKAIRVDFDQSNYLSLRQVGTTFQQVVPYGFDQNNYFYNTKYYTLPVLYNDVFSLLTNGTASPIDTTNTLKSNILNRVFESFRSFKSNRKISSDDIARIDQHMGFLADLQNSLNVTLPPVVSCAKPSSPTVTKDPLIYSPLYIDLMSVAFQCGLTKFGSLKFEGQDPKWLPGLSLPDGTGLHGAVHGGSTAAEWALKRHAHTTYDKYNYNQLVARFLSNMNIMEGTTGRTYLDNMVTAVLPKFGMEDTDRGSGHDGSDTQTMLFGSMGGRLRTGSLLTMPTAAGDLRLPYNSVLVTLLEMMGVPPTDYVKYSNRGKGWGHYVSTDGGTFGARFFTNIPELIA